MLEPRRRATAPGSPGRVFRRRASRTRCLVGILAAWLAAACGPGESAPGPGATSEAPAVDRIVLVTIDTLRADRVGAYGDEAAHTPNFDALAARGVRFETAISPAPITLPAHSTLLTGLLPPRHGVRHNSIFRLPDELPTLAERLRDAGFATAAFLGAIVLDRQYGLARGFDHYDDQMSPRRAAGGDGFSERTADRVVDSAVAWLAEAPHRFFAWLHFYDPHANYEPPAGFRAAFPSDAYAGEIAFSDAQLGRFLEAVGERGDSARTLVVVTSDHGEGFGEHGEVTHSLGVYDSTQRIPLVAAGAGLPEGLVVGAPVGLVDVAPTILALAGAEPLPDIDGRDLRSLLAEGTAEPPADAPQYVETLATEIDLGWSPLLGLRTRDYKYIRAPRPELYDVRSDPAELRDLAGERPDVVRELDAVLDGLLAGSQAASGAPRMAPDDATRARLAELGYVIDTLGEGAGGRELGRVGGIDPKDGIAGARHLMAAMVLMGDGRPGAALGELERVEHGGALVEMLRAEATLALGDPARAETHARNVLADHPESMPARRSLGLALEGQGRVDEARSLYLEVAAIDEASAWPITGLGRLAEQQGDRAEAERQYRRALERRGHSDESLWRLAALAIEDGRDPAPWLDPLSDARLALPDAVVRLAEAEARAGRTSDARRRLRRAMRSSPGNAQLADALEALPPEG